jgi:ketosteroid isomerase-like protein
MRRLVWIGVVAMVAQSLTPSGAGAQALDSLVANERAFAALAAAKGIREAFLTYLADDGVLFRPTATNGKKAWEARPETKAQLLWEPSFGEVSSAGDLGYTTGPWELRPPPDSSGTPAPPESYQYGHFSSVWKKQRHGSWRVVADIGVTHARPVRGGVGSGAFVAGPALPIRTMKGSKVNLNGLDRNLSKAMRAAGAQDAVGSHATADLRLNAEGKFPAVGLEAAQALADSMARFYEFWPEGSGIASSGDLAYTYGWAQRFVSADAAPADSSVYLHVWRQEGGRAWKLALAVWNPLRPH